ncbi:MAG TPA: M15 family metallopeptidase [Actinomycetota bacterium]|nr:M15 family metallopeptidase [Actinomycetota bacterium]
MAVEDLRLLTLTHWGFDGLVHTGQLVVAQDQVSNVVTVMRRLFDLRFPIDRMEPVDNYGGDDDRSMAANNTSAFNCREVESSPGTWSEHAYGRAIDINPVQNPYIPRSGEVQPPAGRAYTERSDKRPGMVVAGDDVVAAFRSVGWEWGGNWAGSKDYQHFSSTGR